MKLVGSALLLLVLLWPATLHCQSEIVTQQGFKSFPDVVERVKQSIGFVEVQTNIQGVSKCATVFLVSKHGLLATCKHTFIDTLTIADTFAIPDTAQIFVTFNNHGRVYQATIVSVHPRRDILLLQIPIAPLQCDSLFLMPVEFGDTKSIRDGDDIACSGYDLSQQSHQFGRTFRWLTTHRGIVSCVKAIGPDENATFLDDFQMDAVVNQGASGGPVYRIEDGKVIGMITGFQGYISNASTVINYGLANCVPSWAICRLISEFVGANSVIKSDTLK